LLCLATTVARVLVRLTLAVAVVAVRRILWSVMRVACGKLATERQQQCGRHTGSKRYMSDGRCGAK
jgi:hypothetical protein